MKTLSEATKALKNNPEFWNANEALSTEISSDPDILMMLFLIAATPDCDATKLMKTMCVGIAIGMEMEKS